MKNLSERFNKSKKKTLSESSEISRMRSDVGEVFTVVAFLQGGDHSFFADDYLGHEVSPPLEYDDEQEAISDLIEALKTNDDQFSKDVYALYSSGIKFVIVTYDDPPLDHKDFVGKRVEIIAAEAGYEFSQKVNFKGTSIDFGEFAVLEDMNPVYIAYKEL